MWRIMHERGCSIGSIAMFRLPQAARHDPRSLPARILRHCSSSAAIGYANAAGLAPGPTALITMSGHELSSFGVNQTSIHRYVLYGSEKGNDVL